VTAAGVDTLLLEGDTGLDRTRLTCVGCATGYKLPRRWAANREKSECAQWFWKLVWSQPSSLSQACRLGRLQVHMNEAIAIRTIRMGPSFARRAHGSKSNAMVQRAFARLRPGSRLTAVAAPFGSASPTSLATYGI